MEKVRTHFIFCLLIVVAPFLPHFHSHSISISMSTGETESESKSESFLIGRGTINSMNLSSLNLQSTRNLSGETFPRDIVGKSVTSFTPANHNSYNTIKNNKNNNNNDNSSNNTNNYSRMTLSRIYEEGLNNYGGGRGGGRGGGGGKHNQQAVKQRSANKEKFQDVRKTHHHKLFSEDTPWTKDETRDQSRATSSKDHFPPSSTPISSAEVEQEEELNASEELELQIQLHYQLQLQYQYQNETETENVSDSKNLESDLEDWNSTLMNFRLKFPVKKWESFGLFTEGYINSINKHWLTFEPASPLSHHIMAIIYIILMIIGCSGNLLVVFMFCRCRTLRTPANYLVVNLAVSDFVMLAKTPIFIINSFYEGPVLGSIGCQIYGFLGGLTGTASIMTLTSISVDRYFVIVYPLNPYKKTTSRRALLMIVAVWFYAGFFSSMPLGGINEYTPEGYLTSCSFDYLRRDVSSRVFIFIFFLAAFCLPLTLIIFSYAAIFRVVVQAEKLDFFNGENSRESCKYRRIKERIRKDVKIALLTTFIVIIWVVAWTPYAVVALLGIFGQEQLVTPLVSTLPALFCKAASVIDPFVYSISHPRFQREFRNKFRICFNKTKENGTLPRNLPNQTSFNVTDSDDSVNLDQTQIQLNVTGPESSEDPNPNLNSGERETFRKNPQANTNTNINMASPLYYSSSSENVQNEEEEEEEDAVERDSFTEHDSNENISPNPNPKDDDDDFIQISKMTSVVNHTQNENLNENSNHEKKSEILPNDNSHSQKNPEEANNHHHSDKQQEDKNNFNKNERESTPSCIERRRSEPNSYSSKCNTVNDRDNNNTVIIPSGGTRFLSMSNLTHDLSNLTFTPPVPSHLPITTCEVQIQN